MAAQIELSQEILKRYLKVREAGLKAYPDRDEVVAYATLSALAHHWPSRSNSLIAELLERASEIKVIERSRYATQRRIAIAKLSRVY